MLGNDFSYFEDVRISTCFQAVIKRSSEGFCDEIFRFFI